MTTLGAFFAMCINAGVRHPIHEQTKKAGRSQPSQPAPDERSAVSHSRVVRWLFAPQSIHEHTGK
jgi:hypothetical protein